jgi:hypothetical protein
MVTKGLTPEQQAAIDFEDSAPLESLTPEQQKRRYQRAAKRKERAKKAEANAEAKAAKLEAEIRAADSKLTIQKFWERNRDRLDETTRAQYVTLHEQVLDQLCWMWDQMHGTYDVKPEEVDFYVSLEEGYDELKAFVAEHGDDLYAYDLYHTDGYGAKNYDRPNLQTVECYKDDWTFRESCAGMSLSSRIFLTTGLLTAMPNRFVSDFHKFYRGQHATTTPVSS